ncbi:MAG: hypothetical protein JWM11_7180, partial [Planctomycetaceae bacterium]|nr:hypothetical protein [Planctomycetaceae bacterium]
MVITSWLTALHGKFFGKKLPSRTRLQQSKAAGQATQAAEGLEQRALLTTLTVVAVNDVYQNVPGLDEDSDFHQDAAGGVLANDPAGTGTRSAIQVGTDPAFLMAADGSFEFDATKLPLLQSLQHGQTQDFLFQYAVSDDNGIGTPAFVDLKIQGLNDPTTATNTDQSNGFTEDQGSPVALGAIVVSDVDANDQITASLSLSDAAAGTLAAPGATFSNGVLTVTGSVSDVNSALGSMTFSPAADYDQDFTIDVNIADGLEDGTAPATGTISMTATAVPDDPIAKDSVFTINEDSGTYYGTLLGSDPDTNPPASLTFALVGAPPTLGAVNITDPATGDFTYTPNTDANGTDTFQFQVTDETLRTSSIRTVTVTINPVNDVPTFTEGADQNVLEDDPAQTVNGWATGLTTGPVTAVDEAGQALHFNVSNDNNSLFAVQPAIDAAGNLTYTLAANANGSATVMVTLSDNGGTANGGVDTSDPQTFAINVTPVNDVPAFSAGADQNVLEDAAPQSIANWATPVSAGAANESGQALTFNVTGNTNPSLFSVAPAIAANGTLTYTLAPDANGSASITITLSDDGGMANGGVDTSASQTFAINVTPVNDAPTFTKGADQTVLEDAPAQTVNGWVTSMA